MMTDEMKQLISAYLDGETTPDETAQAKKYIAEHAQCRQYYESLQNLSLSLTRLKDEEISPDLEQKLYDHLVKQSNKEGVKMEKRLSLSFAAAGSLIMAVLAIVVVHRMYFPGSTQLAVRFKSAADDIGEQFAVGNTSLVRGLVAPESKTEISELALAKTKDKSEFWGKADTQKTTQYEPYYLATEYQVTAPAVQQNQPTTAPLAQSARVDQLAKVSRERAAGGFQTFSYGSAQKEALGAGAVVMYPPQPTAYDEVDKGYYQPSYPYPVSRMESEEYARVTEQGFLSPAQTPLSTFSIDVDTASYSNVRRFLNQNQLPPADAVRIEEMVNYFSYDYPQPGWGKPFSITTEVAAAPWNASHDLVMIGIQGETLKAHEVPPSNLVFLIDVSGSMQAYNKLPLLKQALKLMVNQLDSKDRVSIVTYAGSAAVVLQSTSGDQKWQITQAIDRLLAGGSTYGEGGIRLAYDIAKRNFIRNGNNRVILATDGDFNVGVSDDYGLMSLIGQQKDQGVFLTVLGFGSGNLKDSKMEKLADHGNGNYAYVDSIQEAEKVLVNELGTTLFTIAKDVKVQVEFNPAAVQAYRLIGYENRELTARDFNNDRIDAGEVGAGHSITVFYEIVPNGAVAGESGVDPLKYQKEDTRRYGDELMTVKLRYKDPKGTQSKLMTQTVKRERSWFTRQPSENFRFASAVAEFGMLLRNSWNIGGGSYENVAYRAGSAVGRDLEGHRSEFLRLVERARQLDNRPRPAPVIYRGYETPDYMPYSQPDAPKQFKGQK